MSHRSIRRHLQLLLCFVTGGVITSCILFIVDTRGGLVPVFLDGSRGAGTSRSVLAKVGGTDTKSTIIPDADTKELMDILQQKLKDLNSSGLLLNKKSRTCKQHERGQGLCIDTNCAPLPPRLSPDNIESIRKPVREVGMDKLRNVIKAFDVKPEKKKYVFVTGASSNHFPETEASLQSLHKHVLPHLTNYSLVYYDLGLTAAQRELVREFSGAEYKVFPYDKLPARFKYLKCYIWKPLIVMAHLPSSEFLIWMDSSISFTYDIRPYLNKVSKTGILINSNTFQFPQHVYLKMFEYFGDKPCQFSQYNEVEGGFLVLHNEPYIRHLVIEPWCACALDPNCMCPEKSKHLTVCDMRFRKYGKCHRYDQATIGYILNKGLRESRASVVLRSFYYKVSRGQTGSYMTNLQKAKQRHSVQKK